MVDEKNNEKRHKLEIGHKSGARIRQIRKQLNLRQKEFAEKLKISGPTLSEIETGKFKPGYDLLVNLVKEFNVNLYYVLFEEGDMFIDPIFSSYNRARRYAVNVDDVREFLYHFERSPFLQYFIMELYQKKMLAEKDLILRQIEENESNGAQLACPQIIVNSGSQGYS